MKLILPHRKVKLDTELNEEQRKTAIELLLQEDVPFDRVKDGQLESIYISLEEYLRITWNKPNSKILMDIMSYYLTKEEKNLEILSNEKQKEIVKGSKRHTNFSSLGYNDSLTLGLIDDVSDASFS